MDGFHYAVSRRTRTLVQLSPGLIDGRTFSLRVFLPLLHRRRDPAAFIPSALKLYSRVAFKKINKKKSSTEGTFGRGEG